MNVLVIGSGTWGTALHYVLQHNAPNTVLCAGRNTACIQQHVSTAQIVIMAVKAAANLEVWPKIAPLLAPQTVVVQTAKGLLCAPHWLLPQWQQHFLPQCDTMMLSGPAFAEDLQQRRPAAMSLAGQRIDSLKNVQQLFAGTWVRPYICHDIYGVAIGGALKNVMAIACGLADGLGLGNSARASLASRGFAEMRRLAALFQAQDDTLCGLSGLGDLMLTANSIQSRNFAYGRLLGQYAHCLAPAAHHTTEGIATAAAMTQYATEHRVDVPICNAVHAVCSQQMTPQQAVQSLLDRPLTQE